MSVKSKAQQIVQNLDQLQPKSAGPVAVDTTAAGIVLATAAAGAAEIITSILLFNPTAGALTTLYYMLPTPAGTPTLVDAMKIGTSGAVGAAAGHQLLTRDFVLPAGYQLRAVCSGAGPVNVVVSSRADELV